MTKRILHVVTNIGQYGDDSSHPTGLWLSELTHAWDVFEENGFEQTIISPKGGKCPIEPKSLEPPTYDKSSKGWHNDPARMALLEKTSSPDQVKSTDYDAIYFTGGHGVMFDFTDDEGLHRITREIFERGGVVSSVCHGYCGLLNTKLSDGSYLISGRKMTGFSWAEEELAQVDKLVPYNAEEVAKKHGAKYEKASEPFACYTVVDGKLVTGENPGSAGETAKKVVTALK